MNVELIRYTPDPAELVGEAAAICTNAKYRDKARRVALASGHMSVLEHVSFTFRIEGVSRVLLAQLTRHRIASYSVESQRYCGANLDVVIPERMNCAEFNDDINEILEKIGALYEKALSLGVKEEDARYFTLQAGKTQLIVTMNARELQHFFSMRCCNRAQWEIREMADQMLMLCQNAAPELFNQAGPGCVRGHCPEGKKSCGQPRKKDFAMMEV
jgi:thymidylate synthase (FAD)